MTNWENYRLTDKSLDLTGMFMDIINREGKQIYMPGLEFIASVEELSPIRSRQAAAIVIAQALELCKKDH